MTFLSLFCTHVKQQIEVSPVTRHVLDHHKRIRRALGSVQAEKRVLNYLLLLKELLVKLVFLSLIKSSVAQELTLV